jgi:hypothetical protein
MAIFKGSETVVRVRFWGFFRLLAIFGGILYGVILVSDTVEFAGFIVEVLEFIRGRGAAVRVGGLVPCRRGQIRLVQRFRLVGKVHVGSLSLAIIH